MRKNMRRTNSEQGFTIIELMIALSVLSVLLVMSTVLLLGISKMYSKGVNMSNLQNTDRNIVNDVASALEFGNAAPDQNSSTTTLAGKPVTIYSLCFDTTRYSYIKGYQVSDNPNATPQTTPQSYHAVWEDTMLNAGQCYPLDITQQNVPAAPLNALGVSSKPNTGKELMPTHSRLTAFDVTQQSDGNGGYVYNVTADLAYGDSDLLCDSKTPGDCASQDDGGHLTNPVGEVLCKGSAGQEYCATSHLATSVTRRLK